MSHDQAVYTQEVCEGIRTEYEEQATLQQQQVQQQEQLTAAEAQHSTALAQLAALRLTALHGMPDKLLEQVCSSQAVHNTSAIALLLGLICCCGKKLTLCVGIGCSV